MPNTDVPQTIGTRRHPGLYWVTINGDPPTVAQLQEEFCLDDPEESWFEIGSEMMFVGSKGSDGSGHYRDVRVLGPADCPYAYEGNQT